MATALLSRRSIGTGLYAVALLFVAVPVSLALGGVPGPATLTTAIEAVVVSAVAVLIAVLVAGVGYLIQR